jgi:hypothetical protein
MNQAVQKLKSVMRQMPQVDSLVTRHYWADGMYCRELFRPQGVTIIGKVHKKEHFFIVASGTLKVTNGEEKAVEYVGPQVLVCKPGTQRATYAVTDVTAITVHQCEFTDLEEVEQDLVEYDPEALYLPGNLLKALK